MDEILKNEVLEFIDSLNLGCLTQEQIDKANSITFKLTKK